MKKTFQRTCAILLALALLLACTGAVAEKATLTELGTFPLTTDEGVSFSVMMPQYASQDPNTAWITGVYEDMTGVHVNWTVVPSDAWKQKRALAFASGELPDVIAGMDTANLTVTDEQQYASQGMLIGLNDLIENNTVYLKQILKDNPSYRKLLAQDNGEIYSLPCLAVCYHCNYSQKMFINKTWLDNLGLAMPTTIEEYYNVLVAFKEQDANGNGDPNDEIPLITCNGGWHVDLDGFLMCAFIYSDPDTRMAVEDGKLIFTPTQEGYREGLRFLNKLYAEGLLSPESFTNDDATNQKMNLATPDVAVIGSYPNAYQIYTGDTDLWKQYEILPPLKGADGFVTTPNYELTRNVVRGNFAITSAAKNPELIIRWLDYFYSYEGTMLRLGREGVEWRKAEQGETDFVGNQAAYAILKTPEDDPFYNNIDWTQHIPLNYSKQYRESAVAAADWRDPTINNGTEIQLFQGTVPYEAVARTAEQSIPALSVPAEKASDYARMQTEITDYCKETLVQFITGAMSIDADWDAYLQMLKTIGLDEYMSLANEAYQTYLSR